MKTIPKSFRLMGHTISVEVVGKKDWKYADCVGIFNPETNKIQVLKQTKSMTMHSFWHEVTHAMLHTIGHRLYSNEPFVDQIGGLLAQIMDSAE
jgi:hypothetical protein